jgi:hypothetical protein
LRSIGVLPSVVQQQDPHIRELVANDLGGLEHLDRVVGWHADIDDDQLRLPPADQGE